MNESGNPCVRISGSGRAALATLVDEVNVRAVDVGDETAQSD